MAMIAGDATCTTGMAKRIWDVLSAPGGPGEQFADEPADVYAIRKEKLQTTCYAIAVGVVAEISANASLKTTKLVAGSLISPPPYTVTQPLPLLSCITGGVE